MSKVSETLEKRSSEREAEIEKAYCLRSWK